MVITVHCPSCSTAFPVDTEKVPESGVYARCSECAGVFFVERPDEAHAQEVKKATFGAVLPHAPAPEVHVGGAESDEGIAGWDEAALSSEPFATESWTAESSQTGVEADPWAEGGFDTFERDRDAAGAGLEPLSDASLDVGEGLDEWAPQDTLHVPDAPIDWTSLTEAEPTRSFDEPAPWDHPIADAPVESTSFEEPTAPPSFDEPIAPSGYEPAAPARAEEPWAPAEPLRYEEPTPPASEAPAFEERVTFEELASSPAPGPVEPLTFDTLPPPSLADVAPAHGVEEVAPPPHRSFEEEVAPPSRSFEDVAPPRRSFEEVTPPPRHFDEVAPPHSFEPHVEAAPEFSVETPTWTPPPLPPPPPPPPPPAPVAPPAPAPAFGFGRRDPHEKAKRLARVLVSDMIMYNPERHSRAIEHGSLREDFDDEIKKSWQEYVDQVGDEIAKSTSYFDDALNDILAKGQRVFP